MLIMVTPLVSSILFQIILKILCDSLMQMHRRVSHHVVSLTRIDEEVRLGACLHASIKELQGMLWHDCRVVHADDYLQLALQVLSLVKQ